MTPCLTDASNLAALRGVPKEKDHPILGMIFFFGRKKIIKFDAVLDFFFIIALVSEKKNVIKTVTSDH